MTNRPQVKRNCLRHGYDVRQGRNYASILGCTNDAGRVVRWEVDLHRTYEGTMRIDCTSYRQARKVATFFVGSSNAKAAMNAGAGGSIDDLIAGRPKALPHRFLR